MILKLAEVYLGPCQTSAMVFFKNLLHRCLALNIPLGGKLEYFYNLEKQIASFKSTKMTSKPFLM